MLLDELSLVQKGRVVWTLYCISPELLLATLEAWVGQDENAHKLAVGIST
jgi:hypothetical protein